ncbi:MAG TPA: type VI secretion system protein TssA, partial [Blastocatellia bacterium]|nr:type VI secretion system protein TssA [Blastocatellia bacterium]
AYDSVVDEIRDARRQDEMFERGEWKRDLKLADWAKVVTVSTDALINRTKDLQIAAWLAEALAKLHGLSGVRDGLAISRGLVEHFWEHLYPEIDEENLEARANALEWMSGDMANAVRMATIGKSITGNEYSYLDYQEYNTRLRSISQIDGESERLQTREELDRWNADWVRAREGTSRQFYEELLVLLNECRSELAALDRVSETRFGNQSPGFGPLKDALDETRSLVGKIVKDKRAKEGLDTKVAAAEAAEESGDESPVDGQPKLNGSGPISSRQDALLRLGQVAEYFSATEPHSPVSYLVQRAIKWGQMPLESWLEDVIRDESVLERIREVLGFKTSVDGGRS